MRHIHDEWGIADQDQVAADKANLLEEDKAINRHNIATDDDLFQQYKDANSLHWMKNASMVVLGGAGAALAPVAAPLVGDTFLSWGIEGSANTLLTAGTTSALTAGGVDAVSQGESMVEYHVTNGMDGQNYFSYSELGKITALGFGLGVAGSGALLGGKWLGNYFKSVPNNIVTSGGTADAVAGANLNQVLATTEAANPLVESLQGTGQLPSNYLTKADAISQGWQPGKALGNYVSDGQIGGDVFQNSTGILPSSPGQTWYEADIGLTNTMSRSNQPGTRLLYSNDGLLYVTPDHYQTVFPIGTWK